MREIKFRAWDKWANKMIQPHDGDFIKWHAMSNWKDCLDVMQYTGLTDKNGVEIYEGDILRYLDSYDRSSESGYNFEEFLNVGEIVFNKEFARFDITNKSDIDYDDWISEVSNCEVIGNIYENPELLEENK